MRMWLIIIALVLLGAVLSNRIKGFLTFLPTV